ncbi:MAG TPA: MvaI/BcnI family restriction endonuclease [Candidatus Paceibacterota bacterium]
MITTLQRLRKQLEEIKEKGFIKTHRFHDNGVGKTLEDLLDIKENNFHLPDVGNVELKAKRIDSDSMLTIATKSPEPRGINRILFDKYKYRNKEGYFNLHSTIYGSRKNPQSFQVTFEGRKLVLKNKYKVGAYWPVSVFDDVLKIKSDKILLVLAETKGEKKSPREKFHYIEAYLLSSLNIKKFRSAIEKDKLKIDIRIGMFKSGRNKGKYHDHGTGFRINKRDFLHLFDSFEKLI